MKKYELLVVLPGTLDEKEAEAKVGEVSSTVKEFGEVAETRSLGKSRLAYPIKQVRYGYFYLIIFSAESEKLGAIQDKLNLMRDLLRGIINKFSEKTSTTQKISYYGEYVDRSVPAQGRGRPESVVEIAEPAKVEEASVEAPKEVVKQVPSAPLDLKDIDKKLDEILADDSMSI